MKLCNSDNHYKKYPKLSDNEGLFCEGDLTEKALYDTTENMPYNKSQDVL